MQTATSGAKSTARTGLGTSVREFWARPWRDRIFWIGLFAKGIDGAAELIGGILLLVVSPDRLSALAVVVTQHEIAEDPDDLVANGLLHLAHGLNASGTLFAASYLLLHGLAKVVLVWAVLRERLWAYPWMIAFLIAFILYQCYAIWLGHSLGMILLTLFDIALSWLTWVEYGRHRRRAVAAVRSRG